jgi:hypothetical protein
MLEEKFTEDELKQIIAALESPVFRRYNAMGNDMQRVLGEKLVAETRGTIEPKMQALRQALDRRLGIAPTPAGAASGAKKK